MEKVNDLVYFSGDRLGNLMEVLGLNGGLSVFTAEAETKSTLGSGRGSAGPGLAAPGNSGSNPLP